MSTTQVAAYIRVSGQMYSDSSRWEAEREGVDIIDHRVLGTSIRRHP